MRSSVPSAESGRAGGGIISTTFKSGGNDFHGTVGEIYQGRFLSAAAGKFDDPTSPPVPNYVTHNFYGTVGGPIFLPRPGEGGTAFYNGRNRSFFFFSLNGQRNSTPIFGGTGDPQAVPVPTARMRVGDFSELLQTGNDRALTRLLVAALSIAPIGTIFAPNGTPIPGNDLRNCPSCGGFSPFALQLRECVSASESCRAPVETSRPIARNTRSSIATTSASIIASPTATRIFGRYSKSDTARSRDNFFPLGTSPNGNDLPAGPSAGDEFGDSKGFTLGDTHVFSPTVVNDARFGYTRVQIGIFNTGVNGTGGFSPTVSANLGAPNINLSPNSSGIVLVGIVDELTGTDRATEFTGDGGPFYFLSNNFHVADAVTVVKGNSTYKFGGDYRVRQNSNYDGGRNNGTKGNYQYGTTDSGFVSGNYNGIGPNDTGSSLANFLLGYQPGFVGRGDPGGPYFQSSKEMAFFVQDDWKVNTDLTLNLGLRYDIFTAPTERFDRQSNFVPAPAPFRWPARTRPADAISQTLTRTTLDHASALLTVVSKMIRLWCCAVVTVCSTQPISVAAQPLTANPGTGAGSYACTPITNPGGCPAFFLARNPFDRGVPTAPFTVQRRVRVFAAPTTAVSSVSTIRIARMRCITSTI